MRQTRRQAEHVLFVYIKDQDDSGRFWVYDGIQYHHFFWGAQTLWYVRSQTYLPAYVVGICLSFDQTEREMLERAAAQHSLTLPFFASQDECSTYALLAQQEQFIFDRTFPAGFFSF